jgi:hypothetical protein
MLLVSL